MNSDVSVPCPCWLCFPFLHAISSCHFIHLPASFPSFLHLTLICLFFRHVFVQLTLSFDSGEETNCYSNKVAQELFSVYFHITLSILFLKPTYTLARNMVIVYRGTKQHQLIRDS